MTRKRHEDYSNMVQRLYAGDDISVNHALCRNITFQVTSGCNLRCSYCYEHHKGAEHMSIETGRKIVDYLLDLYEQGDSDFINRNTRAVVLDFIGGEPLLEASLIEKICDYWFAEYTSNWVAELFGPSNLKKSTSGFPQRLYNSVLQGALGIDKDGIFGANTEKTVKEFQSAHGLTADGIAGAKTKVALAKLL